MPTTLIRRSPTHSVVAHVGYTVYGIELLRVTPDQGLMPDVSDLVGESFPDMLTLRRILLSRMRALARGGPQITTMDRVLVSPRAAARWMQIAREAAEDAPADAVRDPDDIPDEQAAPQPDGSLLIWVEAPWGERLEMIIPRDEWRWRDH